MIAVPQLGRVYASATDARQVLHDRLAKRQRARPAPAGEYPDGLAYDPVAAARLRLGRERRRRDRDRRRRATGSRRSRSAAKPATSSTTRARAASSPTSRRATSIAVIDPRTNAIVHRIQLPGCRQRSRPARRLALGGIAFVACDGNAKLLTLDLRTMKVTGSASVGGSPDVLAFDTVAAAPLRRRRERRRRRLRRDARTARASSARRSSRPEAHTVAVDPRTHLVYFPLQSGSNGPPAAADHAAESLPVPTWGAVIWGVLASAVLAVVAVLRSSTASGARRCVLVAVAAVAAALGPLAVGSDPPSHAAATSSSMRRAWSSRSASRTPARACSRRRSAVLLLGFGPLRAASGRRVASTSLLCGLAALLVDVYLY